MQITVSNQNLDWSNGTRTIKSFSPGGINTRAFALQAEDDGGWIDPFEIPSDAPDGMQTLRFREHVEIRLIADDRLPPECSRDVDLKSSFNLLPAGQSSVKLIRDPNMKSAILKSMILKTSLIGWSQNTGAFRSFDFQIQDGPPIALAFDVFVKLDGKEISAGSLSFAANEADGTTIIARGVEIRWPLGKPATVDVILRSDPRAAVNSVDTFECWDGELVFKNVPVK